MPKRKHRLLPVNMKLARIGNFFEGAPHITELVKKKIKSAQRPCGVAMDETGEVFTWPHLSSQFKEICVSNEDMVIGVYNRKSQDADIIADIQAQAKAMKVS